MGEKQRPTDVIESQLVTLPQLPARGEDFSKEQPTSGLGRRDAGVHSSYKR